jgi:hypothetical protein
MVKLEEFKKDSILKGIIPGQSVRIVSIDSIGNDAVSVNPGIFLDFSTITQEIIQHFSCDLGTHVNITLEIEAVSGKGFDDSLRRTVQENSRTLGFNHAEFEED